MRQEIILRRSRKDNQQTGQENGRGKTSNIHSEKEVTEDIEDPEGGTVL